VFPDVFVNIATAIICFASSCHPVLVGVETPRGEFQLQHYSTPTPGYGGDLLVFKDVGDSVFAIHRVLDIPGQQRIARIHSPYAEHRIMITAGCVNVTPEVYQELMDCCYASKIIIK
jgi:hypothetical protein